MTPKLTDDLRQALEEQGGAPLYVKDTANRCYVLMHAEQFEKFKALFGDGFEENDVHPLYPLVEQSFGKAGWDDPEMDLYNDYDAHRPQT